MEKIMICIFAMLALIMLKIIIDMVSTEKAINKAKNNFYYEYDPKPLMTKSEITFYKRIKTLEPAGIHIIPQINLATVLRKKGKYTYQNELFRNIDFGVFDASYNPIFLIELNDKSHEQKNRIERDKKVKAICNSAGIELIMIDSNDPDIEIIKSRLTETNKGIFIPGNEKR
jgi:hypothetical protein